MNAASLKDAGAGLLLLCSSSPLPLPVWERKGVGGKVRAALTPGPSPALRERGDLVYERGIVERRRRRIAVALLISPPASPRVGAEGGWGEGEGCPHPRPLSRAAGEG
jgi:hypothetical protein